MKHRDVFINSVGGMLHTWAVSAYRVCALNVVTATPKLGSLLKLSPNWEPLSAAVNLSSYGQAA